MRMHPIDTGRPVGRIRDCPLSPLIRWSSPFAPTVYSESFSPPLLPRASLFAAVLVVHVGALAWIEENYRRVLPPEPQPITVSIIEPVLIAPEPPKPEPSPPPPVRAKPPPEPEPVREVQRPEPPPPEPTPERIVVAPPPPAPEPLPVQKQPPVPEPERITVAPAPPVMEARAVPEAVHTPPPPVPVELPVEPARYDAAYLDNPKPSYPSLARRMGVQGRVLVRVLVSSGGLPEKIELKETSGSSVLDRSALDAITRWRFVPAKRGEKSIDAWIVVPIVFTLKRIISCRASRPASPRSWRRPMPSACSCSCCCC